jgi:hypothetical protein
MIESAPALEKHPSSGTSADWRMPLHTLFLRVAGFLL